MKDGFVKVAAVTPELLVNGIEENGRRIAGLIAEAEKNGAKIAVFPEMCITGYTCGDLILQCSFVDRAKNTLAEILKKTKKLDILFAVGLPVECCDKFYNAVAVCKDGAVLGIVTKGALSNTSGLCETRYFDTLPKSVSVDFCGKSVYMGSKLIFCANGLEALRISCEIGEDLCVPCPPSSGHSLNGATVILNSAASNETVGAGEARKMLVSSQSKRTISAYVYANAGEGESTTDVVFAGNSLIYQNGACLSEAKPFEHGIAYGVIDVNCLSSLRRRSGIFVPEYDDEYKRIYFDTKLTDTQLADVSPTPFVASSAERLTKDCEEAFSVQCQGLKKRIKHIGLKTVTVGVSGGLDSTLALLASVRAFDELELDRKGIIAVSMPCFGTTDRTRDNSKKLAEALNVAFKEIRITDAVKQHFKDIGVSDNDRDVTYENAQARERTQVLMDIANKTGGIVVGTGDLSELALGFATYNGDQMSMYGVNASIPKTLMRSIVRYLAEKEGGELKSVLLDIVETPVSPELLPPDKTGATEQRTEEIVGPYEVHDFILYYFAEFGFERRKIERLAKHSFKGIYDERSVEKWIDIFYRRFFANQFKRSAMPDGPKASCISLSPRGGWEMPSDAVREEYPQKRI